jgi:hypothetical protein
MKNPVIVNGGIAKVYVDDTQIIDIIVASKEKDSILSSLDETDKDVYIYFKEANLHYVLHKCADSSDSGLILIESPDINSLIDFYEDFVGEDLIPETERMMLVKLLQKEIDSAEVV